jgi:hypothetical protein
MPPIYSSSNLNLTAAMIFRRAVESRVLEEGDTIFSRTTQARQNPKWPIIGTIISEQYC